MRTYPAQTAAQAKAASALASDTSGLSEDDLLYVLLVFAGLVSMGILTRRVARTNGPESNNH